MHRSQTKHNGVGCAKTPAAILRSQQAIRWSSSTGGAMSGGEADSFPMLRRVFRLVRFNCGLPGLSSSMYGRHITTR
jgi:hypothetical protein